MLIMQRQVSFQTAAGHAHAGTLNGYPDHCPRCHKSQVPKLIGTIAVSSKAKDGVEEVFQCTNAACGGLFLAFYEYHLGSSTVYTFSRSFPVNFIAPIVGELITTLSPTFFETYTQALQAESLGLTQLTGIGLRKALEFLVKDFAIGEAADEKEKEAIRHKMLGPCIKEHIADASVQNLASRAAWLGNDETHYIRRWEDKDVSDLKVLLRLVINRIENALLEKKYMEEMPDGKK